MPRLDGLGAMRALRERVPGARVIVLTSFLDDEKLLPALRAGAAGYLLKNVEPQELARAIRAASAGEVVLDPVVAARLVDTLAGGVEPLDLLTPREREVLELIGRGFPNKLIARELGLSEKTVKTHVGHVLAKLGVTDRTQAAVLAVRAGLVEPRSRTNCPWRLRPRRPYGGGMPIGIITGASRGLGLALTRALAERGWRLVVDARDAAALAGAVDELDDVAAIAGRRHRRLAPARARRCRGRARRPARQQRQPARPEPAANARGVSARRAQARLRGQRRRAARARPGRLAAVSRRARRSSTSPPTPVSSPTRAGAATARRRPRSSSSSAILAAEQPELRVYAVDPGDMRTEMHQEAFPGEDISDRPPPEESVPGLLALIEG